MSNLKLAFCSLSLELFTILINISIAYNRFGVTSTWNLYFAFLPFPLLGFSTMQKSNQMLFRWEKPVTLMGTVTWDLFFFFFFEIENSFNKLNEILVVTLKLSYSNFRSNFLLFLLLLFIETSSFVSCWILWINSIDSYTYNRQY